MSQSARGYYEGISGPFALVPDTDNVTDLTPVGSRLRNITIGGVMTAATFVGVLTPSLPFQLGAAPNANGVIDIDAATAPFAGTFLDVKNAGDRATWTLAAGNLSIGGAAGVSFVLQAGGQSKWTVSATAAISELVPQQTTSRIVAGSANGFTIRDSTNAQDLINIVDGGITIPAALAGTYTVGVGTDAAVAVLAMVSSAAATPGMVAYRSSGTLGAPGALASGAGVCALSARGFDGTAWSGTQAGFIVAASEAWAVGAHGCRTILRITAIGTTTVLNAYAVESGGANTVVEILSATSTVTTGSQGSAISAARLMKQATALANAAATTVVNATIPNAAHSAMIKIRVTGSIGAGGAIGANEASATNSYHIVITRTAGLATVAAISAAYGAAASNVAGGTTVTAVVTLAAVTGANNATQTLPIQITVTRGAGASTNHTALIECEVENANATGVTIA